MSYNEVVAEGINSFASPSVTIPASALQAILDGLQELKDEVSLLRATVAAQDEKIAVLGSTQDTQADNQLIQLQLINQLREAARKEPQPTQRDRGEILRALLAASGGKMLAKDARLKMHLSRSRFSELITTMGEYIETRPYHLKKNQKVLVLKSNLVPRNMEQL